MAELKHWTQRGNEEFAYAVSSHFVSQLEVKMEKEGISRKQLAERLKKTSGRVSQLFNDPGNLSVRVMVEFARALNMKVGVVAYDDHDSAGSHGPIHPSVFVECWQMLGGPTDLFEVEDRKKNKFVEGVKKDALYAANPVCDGPLDERFFHFSSQPEFPRTMAQEGTQCLIRSKATQVQSVAFSGKYLMQSSTGR